MAVNRFNTTPESHPELYRDGMYIGKCKQLVSGQPVTPKDCARSLVVAAVNIGWSVGDVALQIALTMRRKMGVAISPSEEQAHGVTVCAYAAEIRRRIASTVGCEEVLRFFNVAVEDEMPYGRYGCDGESCHSGGMLFCKFFGTAGNHIYSEFAAVNGDLFGSMMQRIRSLASNMLSRVIAEPPSRTLSSKSRLGKSKIIKCPCCGREVSTDCKTCWCCDYPIQRVFDNETHSEEVDVILREVSADYDAYAKIPNELTHEYPFLIKHQSHEFALQVALTMILYAAMKYVTEAKRKDEYSQEMLRLVWGFASAKYDGGPRMLMDVVQYQGDYVENA